MKYPERRIPDTPESGLTLVEMLIAVSVLVIIGGSAYLVFKTAIDVYSQIEAKMLAAQRCRAALDRLVTDLRHIQVAPDEPELSLYTQDMPSELGDRDMLSLVTLVKTDPDPFLSQLNSGRESAVPVPLVSDVQRVAYFVGAEMPPGGNLANVGTYPQATFQNEFEFEPDAQTEELALFRVATTTLDPEEVIGSLLERGTVPETDANGEPIHVDIATLITGIVSFDLKYFDGESETWYNSWDETESIPSAVQILIMVRGETQPNSSLGTSRSSAQTQTATQPNVMTQSTRVSLR